MIFDRLQAKPAAPAAFVAGILTLCDDVEADAPCQCGSTSFFVDSKTWAWLHHQLCGLREISL